jgi:hypothetical protein
MFIAYMSAPLVRPRGGRTFKLIFFYTHATSSGSWCYLLLFNSRFTHWATPYLIQTLSILPLVGCFHQTDESIWRPGRSLWYGENTDHRPD